MTPADVAALPFAPGASSTVAPRGEQKGGLPFASPSGSASGDGAPEMTIEQYAWLCATLAKAPESAASTLAWMKISAADKDAIDRRFEEIFRRDGKARARFFEAMAAHTKG